MVLTTATAFLYPRVIQYKRGGWRKWVLSIPACITLVLDIIANHTELAWIFGWPEKGDYTITRRIRRMLNDPIPARAALARGVQVYLDACEPDGKH